MAVMRVCTVPRCPNLTEQGKCETHQQESREAYERAHPEMRQKQAAYERSRPSSSQRGYGADWRKLRAEFLAVHRFCADPFKRGCVALATDVDHVRPRANGGTDDWSNLQPLCHSCHSRKTAKQGRWRRRNQRG